MGMLDACLILGAQESMLAKKKFILSPFVLTLEYRKKMSGLKKKKRPKED